MKKRTNPVLKYGACISLLVICLAATAFAQTTPDADPDADPAATGPQSSQSPTPSPSPTPSLEKRFFKNVLHDQKTIWLSPFHMDSGSVKFIAPLGVGTAVLMATDTHTAAEMAESGHSTRINVSNDISTIGSGYVAAGIAAGFYLVGREAHNARARETGLLTGEALVDVGLVGAALKGISGRLRPSQENGVGEFWDAGSSFPSGHSLTAWAVASMVAREYHTHPLIKWGAYGLAAAVSISRYTGQHHFLSDVLVGSAIGYGVGRFVYQTHHDPSLDSETAGAPVTHSKLIPTVAPLYARAQHLYGARLGWSF
jgi:membrane-associated phospholipid phosphatase